MPLGEGCLGYPRSYNCFVFGENIIILLTESTVFLGREIYFNLRMKTVPAGNYFVKTS